MMCITFILLVFYSVLDIQYEEISTWKLQAGILLVFSIGAVSSANISRYVIESLAVYIGIYLFARALRKWVGGADFDIIYLMMGAQNMYIYIFMLLVLCSGLYMLLSKSDRNKRLPLIPVMTAAYVITIFIIRGGVYWEGLKKD